jgi:hypothetical protein
MEDGDLDDTKVFADELQARGDPRGELLSLELVAEHTPTSAEARRLNREAQRIRDAHPALVWPEALRSSKVDMRAGFVVRAAGDELFADHVPSELALGVRGLSMVRRFEDLLPKLIRGRASGLALDWLHHTPSWPRASTKLADLRVLGAGPGRWPAIRYLELSDPLENIDAIAGLTGLEGLGLDTPLSHSQLRSLAGLELKRLRIHTEQLDPVIVELFGATLEELQPAKCKDSLALLHELPHLRSLTLPAYPSATVIADLARLSSVEELWVPNLTDAELLESLRALRLRHLYVDSLDAELLPGFASLTSVEKLEYREIIGEPVDFMPLLARPNLRELAINANTQNELILPATVEELAIADITEPLAIGGTPSRVDVVDCDPRCLPRALLLGVRHLFIAWNHDPYPDFLAELHGLCPNLERLELPCHVDEHQWSAASRSLAELPHLRQCSLAGTIGELAERARAFPDLSMSGAVEWPRSGADFP